jgi:predicted benzoate:H+ symporter BenE
MKGATKELMPQFKDAQQGTNVDPNTTFLAALCQALAGFLFIIPSVLTDVLAILLLLPPVQKALQGKMQQAFAARGASFMMMGGMGRFWSRSIALWSIRSPFGAIIIKDKYLMVKQLKLAATKMRVTTRAENAQNPKSNHY